MFTQDGYSVVLAAHVADHGTTELVTEAIPQVRGEGRDFFLAEVEFGRVIGHNSCVPCSRNADGVYYAKRGEREGHTRMIAGVQAPECQTLVLVVGKQVDYYVVYTAFVGTISAREPWDRSIQGDETLLQESRAFWSRHALVDDGSTTLAIHDGIPEEWAWLT